MEMAIDVWTVAGQRVRGHVFKRSLVHICKMYIYTYIRHSVFSELTCLKIAATLYNDIVSH